MHVCAEAQGKRYQSSPDCAAAPYLEGYNISPVATLSFPIKVNMV